MNQSQEVNEIFEALAKAQGSIQNAVKDKKNPFYKSTYADLASVFDACRKPLSENGLSIIQYPSKIDEKWILVTTIGHKSGQWIRSEIPIILSDKIGPQAFGSAMTYARRYALTALVGIAAEEDDDGERAEGRKPKDVVIKPITPDEFKELKKWLTDDLEKNMFKYMQEKYGIKHLKEMPQSEYKNALEKAKTVYNKGE